MASDDHASGPRIVREPTLTRYDLVLAVIPLSFLAAVSLAYATPISLQSALTTASGASALALVDALFVRPPEVGGRTGSA